MAQNSFKLIQSQPIEDLKLTVNEFEHTATGAKHFHFDSQDTENVFLVAFRTNPEDSTGVAHILEHTSLCGSEKYPVRDPFFLMLRRSLNTFMNAFTSSDWTAYPFATQNRKDYFNLLSVYLDATFFARLDPLDFAQEGHRLEFHEPSNAESDLVFKGVVFNEMKGAMSSTTSMLYDLVSRYLFPTNTYHFNSGGEPMDIPNLTYQQLLDFYKTHYHPSNASFFTFGDIPVEDIQTAIHEMALAKFDKDPHTHSVPNEKRYYAPIKIEEAYGLEEKGPLNQKTFLMLGWLLGPNSDPMERLEAQLLSDVLLDNSASPLRKALETFPHATSPSNLCGLEDSQKEMCFLCGVEGSDTTHADAFLTLVTDVLKEVAEQGVPLEAMESVCHQIEFSQREINGDSYPYGLQLILTALPAAIHRSDPIKLLDIDPFLKQLRHNIKDPNYIKQLTQKLLLDNPHRIQLTVKPDSELNSRKRIAEETRLKAIKQALTPAEANEIIQQSQALEARQSEAMDVEILPKVGIEDINPRIAIPSSTSVEKSGRFPTTYFKAGTNGISYLKVILPTPNLSSEEKAVLPLFTSIMTEIGSGDRDYLATQVLQTAVTGGLSASCNIRPTLNDTSTTNSFFTVGTKCLHNNLAQAVALVSDTLTQLKLNEEQRIKDLVAQIRAGKERGIVGSGHTYAMLAAASSLNPILLNQHTTSGLLGFSSLKSLDNRLKDATDLSGLDQHFSSILNKLNQQPASVLYISDQAVEPILPILKEELTINNPASSSSLLTLDECTSTPHHSAWFSNTEVNFCAQAFTTVPMTHADSPALTVLGQFLRNGYLHRAIREQGGAYGGGASHDSAHGIFKFFSYRDPRIAGTLQDFQASVQWVLNTTHEARTLEEAILSVISSLDKPSSPAGEAQRAHFDQLYGLSPEFRQDYRQRVINVTLADLQRVTDTYLTQSGSTAILTSESNWESLSESDLENANLENKAAYQTFSI